MIDLRHDAFAAMVAFVALSIVYSPLERVFAAHRTQRFVRPGWRTDLAFFIGQYVLWNGVTVYILGWFGTRVTGMVAESIRATVATLPHPLQLVGVFVLSDLCMYWGHRLQHRSAFLWRFHSVHHTSKHLDWLAAHREHPLDGLFTQFNANLPAFLLGVSLHTALAWITFRGLWAIFVHSNVRIPLGSVRYLIGAPELHHWHHEIDANSRGNFANLLPALDVIFGTFYCPPNKTPEQYGIRDTHAEGYLALLLTSFRRTARIKPMDSPTTVRQPTAASRRLLG